MRPYMTEEEAMGKWCPMVRYVNTHPDTVEHSSLGMDVYVMDNRGVGGATSNDCLGSACMWWGTSEDLARVDRRGITALGRCEAPGGAA